MVHPQFDTLPRLLVVDDEFVNRELLSRVLSKRYEIEMAADGMEALEKLNAAPFDVVLLDMMMPNLNGMETLAAIRANTDLASLPVIMVSAVHESRKIVDAIQMGANDYITKPLDVSIVQARVQTQVLLKRMTDERRDAIAALESANQMKARMMQVASHDLKNPLNNLNMMLTLMCDYAGDNPQVRQLLQIADESVDNMQAIIDDFLSKEAVDNNGITVHLETLDSKQILQESLEQYALAARSKQIELHVEADSVSIRADARRLQQVFGNLISNAIKYSPKQTKVWVQAYVENGKWRLEVQDSGAGIPERERRHLFTPFSKSLISTKPTNGESSTGLGLWIASEMMRLQEGKIGMRPAPNGGSIFWLELPVAASPAYAAAV